MQVRTPKRYRGTSRRSLIPCRRIAFWVFAVVLIVFGFWFYTSIELFRPMVNEVVDNVVGEMDRVAQTATAPTPTPTQDPTNRLIQADNFWQRGAFSEATRLYRQIAEALPNNVQVHNRIALGLITQRQLDEALDYAERAITADPFNSDAWAIHAWVQDWRGNERDAIVSGLYALELDENNARAMAYLAEAYFAANQIQRALNLANEAVALDPDSPEAWRARGFVRWLGQADNDGALEDFRTGYQLAQQQRSASMVILGVDIATIEAAKGNTDEAVSILESILEVNPENTSALFQLGTISLGSFGDPGQAQNYFQRCVDFNPESISCLYWLGRAQERLDQFVLAAESFNQAIELGSRNPYHYWWAGDVQISLGNCQNALAFLQPGYNLAVQSEDTSLIEAYDYNLARCQGNTG